MLTTALTRLFDIQHPLVQSGMSEAGPALASAVSNAGALGSLGTIGKTPDTVAAEIAETANSTDRPFAVNVVTFDWAPFAARLLDAALEAKVPIVTLSFGDPVPGLERCRAAGVPCMVQVQDLEGARRALAAGADCVIAQGNEAGGHTGRRGTLSLAAQVLDIAGETPVGVAGGIATGRGLAAALAMGAGAAVLGTRFKATPEFPAIPGQKEEIVANDGSNTLYDEINDVAYGMQWPNNVTGRVIGNAFTEKWAGRHDELAAVVAAAPQPFGFVQSLVSEHGTSVNWGGESAGLVSAITPAAQVVAEVIAEAEELLGRWGG